VNPSTQVLAAAGHAAYFTNRCLQGKEGKPDTLSYRTTVDAMIAASSYNVAVALCLEAHDLSIFSHYSLPRAQHRGPQASPLPGPKPFSMLMS